MSNSLGSIYGTTKNGDKHIKVNTDYFDVSATFLISKNGIQFNKNQSELLNNDNSLINKVNNMLNTNNDASFGNVDISGSLNVQGEKVMTVPALDICGNDLSANTTYEITTGPPGSINNISFVKKQQAFIHWEVVQGSFQLNGMDYSIVGAGHTVSGKNLIRTTTLTRNGQAVAQASNIEINTPANGRIRVQVPGLYLITGIFSARHWHTADERRFAATIFINNVQYGVSSYGQINGSTGDGSWGYGIVSISAVAMLEAQDVVHYSISSMTQNDAYVETFQGQIAKIN